MDSTPSSNLFSDLLHKFSASSNPSFLLYTFVCLLNYGHLLFVGEELNLKSLITPVFDLDVCEISPKLDSVQDLIDEFIDISSETGFFFLENF
jgi:hypothetical protein